MMHGVQLETNLEGGLNYSAKGGVPLWEIYSQTFTNIATQVVI